MKFVIVKMFYRFYRRRNQSKKPKEILEKKSRLEAINTLAKEIKKI